MEQLYRTSELRNSLGQPLAAEEQASLIACLRSAQLGVESCLVEGLPGLYDHLMRYLEESSISQADDLELVEGAMLLVEQLSMSLGTAPTGQDGPSASHRFEGQWQSLVTIGGGGWPRLQYTPVIEVLQVPHQGCSSFRLETKAGPLYMVASGEATWSRPNHLHYHVTDLRAEVLGRWLRLPALTPRNDLLVFAMGPDAAGPAPGGSAAPAAAAGPALALARSSNGGLTLLGRPV